MPDEKTAVAIADAVLVAQYGEERVKLQRPLHADGSRRDLWLVQGAPPVGSNGTGQNFGVWIDKHTGCLKIIEHMK